MNDVVEDPMKRRNFVRSTLAATAAVLVGSSLPLDQYVLAHPRFVLEGDSPGQKSDWLTRKRAYLAHLGQADVQTRLVAGCDKVHNLRSTVADLHHEGASTLERFTGRPAQICWYYEALRSALAPDLPTRLLAEFDALLEELRRYVPDASPDAHETR